MTKVARNHRQTRGKVKLRKKQPKANKVSASYRSYLARPCYLAAHRAHEHGLSLPSWLWRSLTMRCSGSSVGMRSSGWRWAMPCQHRGWKTKEFLGEILRCVGGQV
jgi:hypothetical protein